MGRFVRSPFARGSPLSGHVGQRSSAAAGVGALNDPPLPRSTVKVGPFAAGASASASPCPSPSQSPATSAPVYAQLVAGGRLAQPPQPFAGRNDAAGSRTWIFALPS